MAHSQSVLNTTFLRYFFSTYKKGGWLVAIGLVTAVYLTVSSVFANKLELANLTYFNAMFSLAYFSVIIGFGFANGASLFANQNHTNSAKVNNYARQGLRLVVVFSALFCALLILFPGFIINNLLQIDVQSNMIFYYLTVLYIFLNCILQYLTHFLKNLKLFRMQFVLTVSFSALFVLGLALLGLFGDIALNAIGIVYIIASVVCIAMVIVMLQRNKEHPISLLKAPTVALTKKEFATCCYMAFTQIVWQVGYLFTALFLLRMSELFFNSYAYFENVLDLFNTLYFAFITIVSINITRSIGNNQKQEAYQHGKYSIYASLLIWLIYFVISLALFLPIKAGMNPELQSIAFISIILYLIIYLPRFVFWNLSSYILIWGGQVKIQFVLEVITTLYYILLYFLAPYLPQNIFLAFGLLMIDNLVKIPIELYLFKSKTWLNVAVKQ